MWNGLRRWQPAACLALILLEACASGRPQRAVQPVPASRNGAGKAPVSVCSARVRGVGEVDVEGDYLPRVVACENGGAGLEALKAQAVAARTYLNYVLGRRGSIADGASAQVYGCGRPPQARHFRAVSETRGQVLQYQGRTIAAFYVAGAKHTPPSCSDHRSDPTRTEHYVTYNGDRLGSTIHQSRLGRIDARNLANRGAMSQNGARCLAQLGWSYDAMLRYYYGRDIQLVQASSRCGGEPAPLPGAPTAPSPMVAAHPVPVAPATQEPRPEDFDFSHETVDFSHAPVEATSPH